VALAKLLSVNSDAMAIPSIEAFHQYPASSPIVEITTFLRSVTAVGVPLPTKRYKIDLIITLQREEQALYMLLNHFNVHWRKSQSNLFKNFPLHAAHTT
jgi:hypothetical protein